jgi:hypothetical protein
MWDANNIRDVKNIMQDVSISMQTNNRDVNTSEAVNSMTASTGGKIGRLEWMQAIERTPATLGMIITAGKVARAGLQRR